MEVKGKRRKILLKSLFLGDKILLTRKRHSSRRQQMLRGQVIIIPCGKKWKVKYKIGLNKKTEACLSDFLLYHVPSQKWVCIFSRYLNCRGFPPFIFYSGKTVPVNIFASNNESKCEVLHCYQSESDVFRKWLDSCILWYVPHWITGRQMVGNKYQTSQFINIYQPILQSFQKVTRWYAL